MSMICLDCSERYAHHKDGTDDLQPRSNGGSKIDDEALPENPAEDFVCPHWKPEYWEKKGYVRNWGDAAIMNWPKLEVLRKETEGKVEYLVLAPTSMRRPATYFFDKGTGTSWGGY